MHGRPSNNNGLDIYCLVDLYSNLSIRRQQGAPPSLLLEFASSSGFSFLIPCRSKDQIKNTGAGAVSIFLIFEIARVASFKITTSQVRKRGTAPAAQSISRLLMFPKD